MKCICDSCEKYPCSVDETKLMLSCPAYSPKPKPITNADRFRAISDEELAFELAVSGCPKPHFVKENEFVDCPAEREPSKADCVACWLDWLKEEAEDD